MLTPIAVRAADGRYFITFQNPEPEMHDWLVNAPGAGFVLEVSALGQDNWQNLGTVQAGELFEVPKAFQPVPLFRTRLESRSVYIGVRRIELEGTSNFRDIGGYSAGESNQLKHGKIFRSDNLASLTPSDWSTLETLGIGTIIDLRRMDEKQRSRTQLPRGSSIEVIEIPIDVEILGKNELLEHILTGKIKRVTDDDMTAMYQDMIAKSRTELSEAVSLLLDPNNGNKVVHCTAGKDRTGLSVALVQSLCNVPRQEIISDFLLSNSFRTPARIAALSERLESHQIDIDDIVPYLSASRPALIAALEILDREYDGAKNYVELAATVSADKGKNSTAHLLY